MIRHLTAERQALVLKEQRVCEVKETQHAAKMEAIRGRRDRKVLAALKLEADKRAQRCTSGVSSVPATVSVSDQGGRRGKAEPFCRMGVANFRRCVFNSWENSCICTYRRCWRVLVGGAGGCL